MKFTFSETETHRIKEALSANSWVETMPGLKCGSPKTNPYPKTYPLTLYHEVTEH